MTKLNLCTINWLLTNQDYLDYFNKQINKGNGELSTELEKAKFEFTKLNFQRSSRLEKTFEPAEESKNVISQINNKQQWIIITEIWCGDSAQSIPVIQKLSQLNNNIDFKILFRDSNLDFMDLYLTNGGRSIPKLIVFDENGNEMFQWGPRPLEVQELFTKLKNDGLEKSDISKEIHLWYGRDRGKAVEKELIELLKSRIEKN